MKRTKYYYSVITLLTALIIVISFSCEREMEGLELADFPAAGEVFIDGFSTGLAYEAWGDVSAFEVDKEISYSGEASMRFAVPDEGETGGYAGGRFVASIPRDLSGYDALTFWAKASKDASIDKIGFGNNAEGSKYLATINGLKVNTNWKKFIIPIPDPSKLTKENGLLYYTEAPEEGSGYTFWIDEVKFEKLGTLAHPQPEILNGNDKVSATFNGISIPIAGLSYVVNLPIGVNQAVEVSPSYFTFSSSDSNVAAVDENGMVTVLSAGTTLVKASLANAEAKGSLTVESTGDFISATEPTVDPADVISVFSDAYTNVQVEYYNGYWQPYQTTLSADFEVAGNHVLNYTNLNFVGIQFSSPTINASNMTYLHLDVFIPNEVAPSDKLNIKVVDLGADGTFDDPNPSVAYLLEGSSLVSQNWISLDIDLSALGSKINLAQIVFENQASTLSGFYADNIYFYNNGNGGSGGNEPTEAAPTPTHDAANVISIYGDAYTNLEGTDYPDWGQATVVSDVTIAGENTLKLAGLNFQGVQLANSLDVSGMEYLHIDYWTENSSALNASLISTGPVEKGKALTVPGTGWSSINIPLADFSPVDLADIIQLKFDGNGDIYLDNIYFYNEGGSNVDGPSTAAPTPSTRDAADVASLFSNAYTDETVDSWSADWDDSDVADVQVAGDDIKKYTFTNFAGIDFSSNKLDVSGMTHFHMDIWTPNEVLSKSLSIKNVDFGGGSEEASNQILTVEHTSNGEIPALAKGSWVSIDVPLTAFAGDPTRTDLAQMILSCNLNTVYIDNIYFYKTGGGTATEPTEAAPAPTLNTADVISVYSDEYTDISATDFNPGWGQSTVYSEVPVAGNNTMLYTGLNYQGIVLGSSQDVSGMEYLHIDYWTANSTALSAFLISTGPVEKAKVLAVPSSGWASIDIPLTDFSPVDLADAIQLKFDGNGDIYVDNIYFYKTGGGTGTEPTLAAPTPTLNAADVISVYSDAYTDISGTDFNPGWGQSTVYSEVALAGDNTMLYTGLNYQGIVLGSSQDVSGKGYLHIDYWTANSTALSAFLISTGPVETAKVLTAPSSGWTSIDIPLTDFSPVNLADAIQLKFDGNGDIYVDNIYFHGDPGGGGGTGAWTTNDLIDFEPTGFGASWKWNVFENDTNNPLAFVANPNPSGINTSATVAKITALQTGGEYVGFETKHGDIGSFSFNADNAIVKIMVYKTVISNVGLKFAESNGEAQPPVIVANTKINEWEELTFDLSGSIGKGITGIIDQIVVFPDLNNGRTENTIFLDNISFHEYLTPAENDASLSDIKVDGSTIAGFSKNTLSYPVTLPEGTTTVPTVTVTENQGTASSVITPAGSLPGETTIVVTAADGTSTKTYTVAFSVQTPGGSYTTNDIIDFEPTGFGASWTWNVFENVGNAPLEFVANPSASGINTSAKVAKITALQAGAAWVGCETKHGDIGSFSFNADNAIVRIMVYKTVISDVGLKFAENNGEAQPEVKVANTKINEWEELTFDLSGSIGKGATGVIDQIIVFPDFNARASDNVIYFDNIRFSKD